MSTATTAYTLTSPIKLTARDLQRGDQLLTSEGRKTIAIIDWNKAGVAVTFEDGSRTGRMAYDQVLAARR